ncbi:TPA: signal peptidase I [Haemophilus influenzae]|uniref:signal peptidase I n=1 Tax=Haemophilus influenzae TaxID=727 RepID=UPI000668A577|nr:signal peptidase I [Haemophilus influenzae]AXP38027.1 signal peptidase I [Haemophilus influenzae]AXP66574.1 signal peptidase I [Haemophilus influenzae]AYO34644.1 signal peptidase I [Haemophilus influenzae]MCK9649730.1 signal peptidase I [Haemophilus influenzae]MCK9651786.1 signal peptidase I [Haemophilus influenzae]
MSNLFFVILLAVGFGVWKVLDYFQLPNTFSILLLILTALSGVLWFYHRFVVLPKRHRQVARAEQRSGKTLSEEDKAKIEPISEASEFLSSLFPVLAVVFLVRSFLFEPFQIPSGSMESTLRVGDFLIVNKYAYGVKDPIFQNTIIEGEKPQRGDVIVFKAPQQALIRTGLGATRAAFAENLALSSKDNMSGVDYIKRIVGKGGDRVIFDVEQKTLKVVYGKEGKPCEIDCETKAFEYTQNPTNPAFPNELELTEKGDVTHNVLISEYRRYSGPEFFPQEGMQTAEWLVPEGQYFVMGDHRDHSDDSRFWGFVPEKNIVGKATYIWMSLEKEANEWPTGFRFDRFFTAIK